MFESISTKKAPAAIGPYSQAVKLGDFVYLSGQLPINPTTSELVEGGIMEQTYQVFQNIESVLDTMGLELRHILKTTVFMSDLDEFEEMNQIYATVLNNPYPARSTVQVAKLPKGAKIEIECIVIDTLEYEKAVREHHHHHQGHDHEHHDHEHHHDCKCSDNHECECNHDHTHDHECDCNHEHQTHDHECEGNCCG